QGSARSTRPTRPACSLEGESTRESASAAVVPEGRRLLLPVAPPALDQRVVEHRFVVVFSRYYDDLVPHARIDDSFAVHLRPKAFPVDPGKPVGDAVHTPTPVAPTDDCDKLASLLVVISCDVLRQRTLGGSTAEEGDNVLSVAPPLVLADRLTKSDVNRAFGARRTDEEAVSRVALARPGPLIRLALPLPHDPPILREICLGPGSMRGALARRAIGINEFDRRIVKARLCKLDQKRAELLIRNALEGHGERHIASNVT